MTEEQIEQKAEEYYNGEYDAWLEGEDSYALEEEITKAFIDGYHECQKEHEWHDLKKDPNDLPKEGIEVLVKLQNGTHEISGLSADNRWFCTDYYTGEDKVIKWKEIE